MLNTDRFRHVCRRRLITLNWLSLLASRQRATRAAGRVPLAACRYAWQTNTPAAPPRPGDHTQQDHSTHYTWQCRSSETARRHSGVSARWVNGTGTNRLTDRPGITRNAASYREGPHNKSKLSRFMKLNYAWSYIIMNWLTHIQTAETCCGEKNITRQKKGDRNNAQFFYDAQMRHFLRQHVVYTQLQMAVTSISPLNLSIIFLSPPALMT